MDVKHLDKKAGRLPMRAYIGPAKNLPLNDRETPSKTEDTVLLAGVFRFSGKRGIGEELGGFIYAFAEITDENEHGIGFLKSGKRFQTTIYTRFRIFQAVSLLF